MTVGRRFAAAALALAIAAVALEAVGWLGVPGSSGVVPEAQAVVGRPLTPVSYAGVARRTARRCDSGAYSC
jgi:hypothetical protein